MGRCSAAAAAAADDATIFVDCVRVLRKTETDSILNRQWKKNTWKFIVHFMFTRHISFEWPANYRTLSLSLSLTQTDLMFGRIEPISSISASVWVKLNQNLLQWQPIQGQRSNNIG